jgi:hypothetical protein
MDPVISVQTLLLRAQMPELSLRPGASIVARVASRGEAHGVIVLAGIPLTAQLPKEVEAGATLRLLVDEVTPERVVLRIDPSTTTAVPPQPPPAAQQPARVAVGEPPQKRVTPGGEERAGVTLAFHSPALGRLDLRIEVGAGRVEAAVATGAGHPFETADAASSRLQDGLAARTGLVAAVSVVPRREPLDVYA